MIEVQPAGWLDGRRHLLQVDHVDDVERRRVTGVALQLELGAGRVRLRQQRVRLVEQPPGVGLRGVGQRLRVRRCCRRASCAATTGSASARRCR